MKKRNWITIFVILAVIILAVIIMNKQNPIAEEDVAKCIGENSELYIQLGCHACETQEEMFGNNYQYLNTIDCFFERELCIEKGIEATPTWIINEEIYKGVQSIDKLKELTKC